MNVITFFNVLFSLKIEIQFYLQDCVETQICILYNIWWILLTNENYWNLVSLYQSSYTMWRIQLTNYLFCFSCILFFFVFVCLFFNRSVTKCFVITNCFPYHYHSLTQTVWFYNVFVCYVCFSSYHMCVCWV